MTDKISCSHAQLLVDAAERGSGHQKTLIPDEEAEYSYQQVGTAAKGWLVSVHRRNGYRSSRPRSDVFGRILTVYVFFFLGIPTILR